MISMIMTMTVAINAKTLSEAFKEPMTTIFGILLSGDEDGLEGRSMIVGEMNTTEPSILDWTFHSHPSNHAFTQPAEKTSAVLLFTRISLIFETQRKEKVHR